MNFIPKTINYKKDNEIEVEILVYHNQKFMLQIYLINKSNESFFVWNENNQENKFYCSNNIANIIVKQAEDIIFNHKNIMLTDVAHNSLFCLFMK